jgi:putative methionine-R-sulfoxide reductase with GAF domain
MTEQKGFYFWTQSPKKLLNDESTREHLRSVVEVEMAVDDPLKEIIEIINSPDDKTAKAESIADVIRSAGGHRWVGIYDVDEQEIAVIAWSGKGAPAFPRFPVNQGLSADAVSGKRTVVCNDVTNDPRYLTAFGNTQSEIIVPIVDHRNDRVVGTLDVESEIKNAFTDEDQRRLEDYASAMAPLWK